MILYGCLSFCFECDRAFDGWSFKESARRRNEHANVKHSGKGKKPDDTAKAPDDTGR